METALVLLGILNLAAGAYSFYASWRYRNLPRADRDAEAPAAASEARLPSVTLFVPCCGREEGLADNLEALARQDYPELEIRFVVEAGKDEAVPVIQEVMARHTGRCELVVAGPAIGRGQKVHNLIAAIESESGGERDRHGAGVYAFADSDGRPDEGWLRRLVAGLDEPGVGATTGYRFYVPEPPSFAGLLRSVWNASVLALLGEHDRNFAWGGSMAIRRRVFDEARVRAAWEGALSDDYALTHAVRRSGRRVAFVPSCLVGSYGSVGLAELLGWTTRQIAVTRVYWPLLFRLAATTHLLYTSFLVVGAAVAASGSVLPAAMLGGVLALSFASGAVRARALGRLTPAWEPLLRRHFAAYVLLVPLASFVTAQAVLRALPSRRITWRGRTYEMRSPTETVVLPADG